MRITQTLLAAVALAAACGGDQPPTSASQALGPVVETAAGTLEGAYADSSEEMLVFRGVAFAKAPVGELRWRPPEAPESWEGARSATANGLPCWQPLTPETSIYSRGQIERSEDCLFLNLWTAAESRDDRLPVMVWFHGGGHRTGHGGSRVFNGAALAQKGVVLVSANYRLGAFGFMAHPGLTAESPDGSSGNYGILDKIQALEWVRENAEAFGGDPDNVTIFGQSAGSASVCTLVASPLAAGLFHKAIGHSGSCLGDRMTLHGETGEEGSGPSAHDLGLNLARAVDVEGEGADAIAALRAVPAETLLESTQGDARSPGIQIDGWVVPRQMGEIFAAGDHNKMPVMTGWMSDEGTALFAALPALELEAFEAEIESRYGEHAEAILEEYADQISVSTKSALQAIQADQAFGWGARTWLREVERAGSPAYHYFFTRSPPVYLLYLPDRPPIEIPEGPRGYGAYHSGDLAYAFANQELVGSGWDDLDREISRVMSQYWVNFARTGDPNGEGVPEWPRYEAASDRGIELGAEIRAVSQIRKAKLDLFDAAR
jgi:para-nitrobenzyl esterase